MNSSYRLLYFIFFYNSAIKLEFQIVKDKIARYYAIVYTYLFYIISLGKDKLGVPASEPVRLVLECDGTQVEDGEYFRTLANNTVLLLLRQGERWYPVGVDVIKAGMYF